MNNERAENYLRDLGSTIREKSLAAAYNIGYLMAWHEIVSFMQSQATQFDIEFSLIGMDGIDPERDLL